MQPIRLSSLSAPQILRILGFVLIGLTLLGYLVFQSRNFIEGPLLIMNDELSVVQSNRVVTLHGYADNIVDITLNGRPIFTDTEGNFSEELVLENGHTIATIAAADRFGRVISLTREFVYVGDPL